MRIVSGSAWRLSESNAPRTFSFPLHPTVASSHRFKPQLHTVLAIRIEGAVSKSGNPHALCFNRSPAPQRTGIIARLNLFLPRFEIQLTPKGVPISSLPAVAPPIGAALIVKDRHVWPRSSNDLRRFLSRRALPFFGAAESRHT